MNDLSIWDIATDFSGNDAAALIVGEKPLAGNHADCQPVIELMQRSYELARSWHVEAIVDGLDDSGTLPLKALESVEMNWQENRDDIEASRVSHTFHNWLANSDESKFERQRFTRQHIAKWLGAVGLKSKYHFGGTPSDKPLGTRERDTLLTIIAVLCKEAKIDYTKHSKAAAMIYSTAVKMGIFIGDSTIEGHLKRIPDALGTRMK